MNKLIPKLMLAGVGIGGVGISVLAIVGLAYIGSYVKYDELRETIDKLIQDKE